jgi:uncharacterized RDD family membrane protein YckC
VENFMNMVTVNSGSNSNDIQYAGFAKRLKAFAYDFMPIFAYIMALFGIMMGMIRVMDYIGRPLRLPDDPLLGDLIAFLTLVLPVILYFSLQESSSMRSTWGKRKVRLLVVNEEGERLTFGRAFLRSFLKFLPWQIAHTSLFHWEGWPFAPAEPTIMVLVGFGLAYLLVGIYLASALISKKNRTLYDWAAGSHVVEMS